MNEAYTKIFQQMVESGQEMLKTFSQNTDAMSFSGLERLIPTMPADLMEIWFGKTFNRDGLDAKTRLLVTLAGLVMQSAALTTSGATQSLPQAGSDAQMRLTLRHALQAGATEREIAEVIWHMSMFGGLPAMQKTLEIAQSVFDERKEGTS